jgi:hypothetical protein
MGDAAAEKLARCKETLRMEQSKRAKQNEQLDREKLEDDSANKWVSVGRFMGECDRSSMHSSARPVVVRKLDLVLHWSWSGSFGGLVRLRRARSWSLQAEVGMTRDSQKVAFTVRVGIRGTQKLVLILLIFSRTNVPSVAIGHALRVFQRNHTEKCLERQEVCRL